MDTRSNRENAVPLVDKLIAEGAKSGLRVTQALVGRIRKNLHKDMAALEMLAIVRRILDEGVPLLGRELEQAIVAGWLAGGQNVAEQLPEKTKTQAAGQEPPIPPPSRVVEGEPEPSTEYPIIEEAAASLAGRRLLSPADYYQASEQARAKAFTVAQVTNAETLAKIQERLVQDIEEGGTLKDFEEFMREETPLGRAAIDNVYRTNVGSSYCRGQEKIADNWQVRSALPYVSSDSINDSRRTELCRRIGQSGIQGSNIFRVDDPVWQRFRPLRHWRCRCNATYMSIEDAAKRGIHEAVLWRQSGVEPTSPAWVPWPDIDLPNGWAPGGGGVM